jgi:predicted TIM-barrel fold metal-dependent hydrolase
MRRRLLPILIALLPAAAMAQPLADHHQHLFSPALAKLINGTAIDAAELVRHLDEAGIKRAVVLSTAYSHSNPARKVANDEPFVRADNDWTAEQVAKYPDRLVGFCGLNPLKDYALAELARCAKNPNLASFTPPTVTAWPSSSTCAPIRVNRWAAPRRSCF